MSKPEDQTPPEPTPGEPCSCCGEKKQTLKLRVGKYASLGVIVTLITQAICSVNIELIP